MNIIWKGSPNKNDPSYRKTVNKVVIHWFGFGDLNSANNRFQNSGSGVSAHYGISDNTVYQWVKESYVTMRFVCGVVWKQFEVFYNIVRVISISFTILQHINLSPIYHRRSVYASN